MQIPINKPLVLKTELHNLQQVVKNFEDKEKTYFIDSAVKSLENIFRGCEKVYLTSSCTTALELSALLCDINLEDEIILPSFTHPGTANPFLRNRAKLVWCDIEPSTMNIDADQIETLITSRTKAVVVVHYAAIACKIERIKAICKKHDLILIEDCAMAIDSFYQEKALGTFGDLAVVSFHKTKNIHCGEGGALIINNKNFLKQTELLINCGTNKQEFLEGKVEHYSWQAISSNFKMSELQAAFLSAQLKEIFKITKKRKELWNLYRQLLSVAWNEQLLPHVPDEAQHNGHLFYIHANSSEERNALIKHLKQYGIESVFHYIPLHNAPIWEKTNALLPVTETKSATLLRLPLYYDLSTQDVIYIADVISRFSTGS